MKQFLIPLSVLVTLSQTNDHKNKDLYLRTGEKTAALLKNNADTNFISKYLEKKSVRDDFDNVMAKGKARKVQRARESEERLNDDTFLGNEIPKSNLKWGYQLDPVLNGVRRRRQSSSGSDISGSGSSSREFRDWKEEWEEMWNKKKLETKNFTTNVEGDVVNMAAARPWGVPCGDPSQHDMPWGSCVLPAECNAEYRIYRGDYFCGRTQFICCSLNFHTYDLYQGLSVSLGESSMEIDSAAERERSKQKTSKERRKRSDRRRKRRKRLREERKRKIRRTIARIVKEVRRILDKAYKNGSKIRKRKTNTMKKFIKFLKRQYKLDRESAKDIHEQQMLEVDQEFMNKLMQIKELNADFMSNDTFRSIIVNHTITLRTAKMLAQVYPELQGFLPRVMSQYKAREVMRRRGGSARRRGVRSRGHGAQPRGTGRLRGAIVHPRRNHRKYLDYDVEYGLLYS